LLEELMEYLSAKDKVAEEEAKKQKAEAEKLKSRRGRR
jgi:hypothetical protein